MTSNLSNKGQSMFELMLAVLVTAITLVGIIGLVSTAVSNNTFSADRTAATRFTHEATEWTRTLRDTNWRSFTGLGSTTGRTYCVSTLPSNILGLSVGSCTSAEVIPGTPFSRELTIVYDATVDQNVVEVEVVTSWIDPEGYHESRSSTFLSNWKSN